MVTGQIRRNGARESRACASRRIIVELCLAVIGIVGGAKPPGEVQAVSIKISPASVTAEMIIFLFILLLPPELKFDMLF